MLRKISFERGTRERAGGTGEGGGVTQRAGLGGVDPAVTLSRLYGPPAEPSALAVPPRHTTFAYPLLAFAHVRNRGITTIESFYDAANRGIMIARCSRTNVIDKAVEMSRSSSTIRLCFKCVRA